MPAVVGRGNHRRSSAYPVNHAAPVNPADESVGVGEVTRHPGGSHVELDVLTQVSLQIL